MNNSGGTHRCVPPLFWREKPAAALAADDTESIAEGSNETVPILIIPDEVCKGIGSIDDIIEISQLAAYMAITQNPSYVNSCYEQLDAAS